MTRKQAAKDGSVQAIGVGLLTFASQQLAGGDSYTADVAGAGGLLALVGVQYLNIKRLPMNSDELQDAAEAVGDELEETVENSRS